MVLSFVCLLAFMRCCFYFLLAGTSTLGNWDKYIYREKKGGIYSRVGINGLIVLSGL